MNGRTSTFPWRFLLVSFGLSWVIWIPIAISGKDYQSSPYLLIGTLLGAFGPGLAAIIFTYFNRDRDVFFDFRDRIYGLHRIRPSWLLIILAIWPATHAAAIGITHLAGSPIPSSPFLDELTAQPNTIPLIIFMYFLQSGVEEIGWRGYLQEKLGRLFPLSASAIVTGLIHTMWHLPLFWIAGTNQIKMGFGPDFLIFILFVISTAVITAWCYYSNNQSVLAAALLHTAGNLSFDIFAYAPGTTKHLVFVLLSTFAAVLILFYFQFNKKWNQTTPASE